MLCALAPMMLPTKPRRDEQMKNHLRPNMSDRRPTSVKPIAKPAVQEMLTHMMFGDGPMAALMRLKVLDGRTQPRYLDDSQCLALCHKLDIELPRYLRQTCSLYIMSLRSTRKPQRPTMTVPMKFILVKYDLPKSAVRPPSASSATWSWWSPWLRAVSSSVRLLPVVKLLPVVTCSGNCFSLAMVVWPLADSVALLCTEHDSEDTLTAMESGLSLSTCNARDSGHTCGDPRRLNVE